MFSCQWGILLVYNLFLQNINLPVYLGVYDFEQLQKQIVIADLSVTFHALPKGCISDELSDVICYDNINRVLLDHVESKRYKLLEHLCYDLSLNT